MLSVANKFIVNTNNKNIEMNYYTYIYILKFY